jgi:hypothetical protein
MRYRLTVIVDDVSAAHVTDGAFWMVLFGMQVWPSSKNTPDLLYNQLLPYLSYKPYSATLADNAANSASDWSGMPVSDDVTQVHALVDACTVVMTRRGVAMGVSRLFTVLLRFQLCLMLYADMHQGSMKGIQSSPLSLLSPLHSPPSIPSLKSRSCEHAACGFNPPTHPSITVNRTDVVY